MCNARVVPAWIDVIRMRLRSHLHTERNLTFRDSAAAAHQNSNELGAHLAATATSWRRADDLQARYAAVQTALEAGADLWEGIGWVSMPGRLALPPKVVGACRQEPGVDELLPLHLATLTAQSRIDDTLANRLDDDWMSRALHRSHRRDPVSDS